eukprot:TRINITY_DN32132_c0_g2_i1.p1 TRINITY_DN32132_c0_g2~~TRINITY_DN32132_c0_g2_i1.p1  ORF type:complete len:990 (-),score=145.75 TRINITY_DN32132_c0_g2_i1:425-3394(-)
MDPKNKSAISTEGKDKSGTTSPIDWRSLQQIKHGQFTVRGVPGVKKYMFVPPGVLNSPDFVETMLKHWKLPRPNLLLEIAASHVPPDKLVTEKVAFKQKAFENLRLDPHRPDGAVGEYILLEDVTIKKEPTDASENVGEKKKIERVRVEEEVPSKGVDQDKSQGKSAGRLRVSIAKLFAQGQENCTTLPVSQEDRKLRWAKIAEDRETKAGYIPLRDEKSGKRWAKIVVDEVGEEREEDGARREEVLDGARDFFERKLEKLLGCVATAVESSGCWFLSKCGAQGNHMALEKALVASKSTPNILVLDDPCPSTQDDDKGDQCTRERARKLYERNYEHITRKLWDSSVPLKDQAQVQTIEQQVEQKGSEKDGVKFYELVKNNTVVVEGWSFRRGTHYVFADDFQDFNPRSLAPFGYLCMNGTTESKTMIREALGNPALPAILVQHTAGTTQDYATIVDALPKSIADPKSTVIEIFNEVEATSDADDQAKVKIADILEVMDAKINNPSLFKDTIVVVDPMNDHPEEVLRVLSAAFAAASTAVVEVGAGRADKLVVRECWRMHEHLMASYRKQEVMSTVLLLLTLVLTILSTAVSVIAAHMKYCGANLETEEPNGSSHEDDVAKAWLRFCRWDEYVRMSSVALPAITTIVSTVTISVNSTQKAGALFAAAGRLVNHIYRFRMRIGEYNSVLSKTENARLASTLEVDVAGDQGEAEENLTVIARRVRSMFAAKVREIYASVQNGHMADDAMDADHSFDKSGVKDREAVDIGSLRNSMYHSSMTPLMQNTDDTSRPQMAQREYHLSVGSEKSTDVDKDMARGREGYTRVVVAEAEEEEDDFVGQMTTDVYMNRVRGLLEKYATNAKWMSVKYYVIQFCIIVAGSVATLLAANAYESAVPLALSTTSALTAVTQHLRLKPRLATVNAAVATLQGCVVFWASCGIVDRRTESTKSYIVEATEDSALAVAMADAGNYSAQTTHAPQSSPKKKDTKKKD